MEDNDQKEKYKNNILHLLLIRHFEPMTMESLLYTKSTINPGIPQRNSFVVIIITNIILRMIVTDIAIFQINGLLFL